MPSVILLISGRDRDSILHANRYCIKDALAASWYYSSVIDIGVTKETEDIFGNNG
jgi:hypothetical protein